MRPLFSIAAFGAGLVFGLGLIVAGMANPAKILAFLDLAGRWDPSLGLVMVGAIAVGSVGFAIAKGRTRSLLDAAMQIPTAQHIDRRLVVGGLAFGVGWGLSGFCPGPALLALAAGYGKALAFVAAMVIGMLIFEFIERQRTRDRARAIA